MVTVMDEQERERILAEARASLERLASPGAAPPAASRDTEAVASEPEPKPDLEPAPALDTAAIDARIAAAIAAERGFTREAIGRALGEALAKEREMVREQLRSELRSLHIGVAQIETALAELRAVLAAERGQVIDLPPLPLRPRVN